MLIFIDAKFRRDLASWRGQTCFATDCRAIRPLAPDHPASDLSSTSLSSAGPFCETTGLAFAAANALQSSSFHPSRMLSIKRVLPKNTATRSTVSGPAISTGFRVSRINQLHVIDSRQRSFIDYVSRKGNDVLCGNSVTGVDAAGYSFRGEQRFV